MHPRTPQSAKPQQGNVSDATRQESPLHAPEQHPRDFTAPHVVILGAGASQACCPKGDANGRKVPLMRELVPVVGLGDLLSEYGIEYDEEDFEALYDDLVTSGRHPDLVRKLESKVYDYFSKLKLPEGPTLYDYLVLALRKKDLIATFNWDPLLLQAYRRNSRGIRPPKLAFLHGTVALGFCSEHKWLGRMGDSCRVCGRPLARTRLLYPVKHKDYNNKGPVIKDQWTLLRHYLENAYFLTIFGFGAPHTDAEAVDLMLNVWDKNRRRQLAQTNLIVKPGTSPESVQQKWKDFIVGSHYDIDDSFHKSWLFSYPRRTCVALWDTTMELNMRQANPFPRCKSLDEVHNWLKPLLAEEEDVDFRVTRWEAMCKDDPFDSARRNTMLMQAMRKDFLTEGHDPDEAPAFPNRKLNYSRVIIHSHENDAYPEPDETGHIGISTWFRADLFDITEKGLELWLDGQEAVFDKTGCWDLIEFDEPARKGNYQKRSVHIIGHIPFANIVRYSLKGDEWYVGPHIYCRFCTDEGPYDGIAHATAEEPHGDLHNFKYLNKDMRKRLP